MADNRKPYPQFNPFRGFVIDELTRRKTSYPSTTNAPFVRLTSCLVEPKLNYMFFTLGLHGFDEGEDFDMFSESYGPKRETVGYAYDMGKRVNGRMTQKLISADQLTLDDFTNLPNGTLNPVQKSFAELDRTNLIGTAKTIYGGGAHPIPGITNVSVKLRGLGQPIMTEVEWKCYNRAQLEFLRHHFLTAGNYVVVEWGQQFADKHLKKTLDFSTDQEIRNTLVDSILKGRNYVIENWVKPNDGNYNYVVGTVANFTLDMDAKTNTYTCRTTIVSVGEQIYGVSMDTTFVKTYAKEGTSEQSSINTMRDFFQVGLKYDLLINQHSTDGSLVAGNYANWSKNNKNINEKTSDLKNVSFNPEDYRFVSWKFFAKILLPELYKLIQHENVRNDLPRIADFWVDDATQPTDPNFQDWVGDNEFLRSTEPDSLLIVKKSMSTVPPAFQGAGMFGDGTGYRGRLNSGVWLNTGMIRQCFMEAESFERGLSGVLSRMTSATAGFWGLRLFWDEETGRFKIIDMKYTDTQGLPPFWKFNDGAQGELLNVKFDSAFPPELVSQMMMYAKFKNESKTAQQDLVKEFPMIGTTSTFMFSVNYTSFHDLLGPDLEAKRGGKTLTATTDNIGARSLEQDNTTTKSRVAGMTLSPAGTVTDGKTPQPGKQLNTNSIKIPDALAKRNPVTVDVVRNSVKPKALNAVNVDTMYRGFDKLDSEFRDRLQKMIIALERQGTKVQVLETFRAQERQNALYQKGRNGNPGPVVTKTLHSNHTLGVACDLLINGSFDATSDFYPTLSNMCTQYGLETIGAWDSGHVQLKGAQQIPRSAWDKFLHGENSVQENTPAAPNVPTATPTPNSSGTAVAPEAQPEQVENDAVKEKLDSINTRFGPGMLPLIEPMQSTLLNKITRHGFQNFPKPNGFVGGFPTSATVTVDMVGLAGVSVSDGFFVDKLPFIFERHGVFQTTEISESITVNGWITSVRGVFKLCWLEGTGHPLPPVTGK